MRLRILAVALVLAAGCTEQLDPVGDGPPGDPAAPRLDATLEGRVVDAAGDAQSGVQVEVRREASFAEHGNAFAAFLFTAGFACIAGACDTDSTTFQTATGPDGGYRATLPKAHLPGFETDADWFVTASRPPAEGHVAGATSGDEFEVADAVQRPPDLPLWLTAPELTVGPEGITTTWPLLDPDPFEGGRLSYTLAFLDGRGAPVWSVPLARAGDRLDPRVLEDTRGSVLLAARGDVKAGHTTYHRTVAAPQPALTGPAGAPPSRGAPCELPGAAPGPCWLTDGDLAGAGPAEPPVATATITVPEMRAGLLVVRGCGQCAVEFSADGAAWQPTTLDRRTGLTVLTSETPVRFVRLSLEGGVQRAAEVSLWPAPPRRAALSPDGLLPRPADRSSREWLVILLAFGLTLVVGGAAWAVTRRLRAPRP